MQTNHYKAVSVVTLLLVGLMSVSLWAQTNYPTSKVLFERRNLGGPRLGITFVTGDNKLLDELRGEGMNRSLSQFGWHFEYQVIPEGGGPQFVIELVPLIAGVEYGKFIPSTSLLMGIRFPGGIEFGLGPNVLVKDGNDPVRTALVTAVGKSFNYGGVSIPLNLVYTTNPDGGRVSFMFGYAVARVK